MKREQNRKTKLIHKKQGGHRPSPALLPESFSISQFKEADRSDSSKTAKTTKI